MTVDAGAMTLPMPNPKMKNTTRMIQSAVSIWTKSRATSDSATRTKPVVMTAR